MLHLCCGNLDCGRADEVLGNGNGSTENGTKDGGVVDYLAVLREIIHSAPAKVWTTQNSEGDTPLHMLVSSPLCCSSDWRSSNNNNNGNGNNNNAMSSGNEIRVKLAQEAIVLALSSPNAIEACLLPERTGATPLHIALASGAHSCIIDSLLAASPEAIRAEDMRGMLPLHWAAAFGRHSYAVLKKLVEEYPMGLVAGTVDGDIPLHLAVSNAMMEEE